MTDYIPVLTDLFSALGVKGNVHLSQDTGGPDYILDGPNGSIAIEVKKAMPIRYKPILETIAYTHLLEGARRSEFKESWLVIISDSIPAGVIDQTLEFTGKHKIKAYIAMMDTMGNLVIIQNGKKMEETIARPRSNLMAHWRTSKISREQTKKSALTFSSGQQWILKHLLLNGFATKYWGEEPQTGLARSTKLGKVTDLAQSACFQTLRALKEQGFLISESRGEYRFRKLRELMTLWKVALIQHKKVELNVEPSRAGESVEEWWSDFEENLKTSALSGNKFTISGAVAAKWLAAKITRELSVVFHLPSDQNTTLEQFLRNAGLTIADSKTAISVQLHANSRSETGVLKYRQIAGLAPYADVIQVALDAAEQGARGSEQGDKIISDILAPKWMSKGWSL